MSTDRTPALWEQSLVGTAPDDPSLTARLNANTREIVAACNRTARQLAELNYAAYVAAARGTCTETDACTCDGCTGRPT